MSIAAKRINMVVRNRVWVRKCLLLGGLLLEWGLGMLLAQPLSGRPIVPQPQKYVRPTESTIATPVDPDRGLFLNGRPWVVFVDRAAVVAVSKPGQDASSKGRQLGFLEPFFVLKDSAEYLFLVKDPALKRGITSEEVVAYGWVSKTQLLLWQSSLGDAWAWKIKKRVLLTPSPKGKNKVHFYQSPELKKKVKVILSPQSYFVYKTDEKNQTVLLGKEERFDDREVKTVILGWVSRAHLLERGNWVFCEPNWDSTAVAERAQTGKLRVFADSLNALQYQQTGTANRASLVWDNDPVQVLRMKGNWQRFPVISVDKDLVKVAVYWPKKRIFRAAFLPIHNLNTTEPNVKYCRLLSRKELAEMISYMEQLRIKGTVEDARIHLKNIVWEMSRPYLGPEMSMPKISQWPFSQVLEAIFGLPSSSELGGYSMNDFTNDQKVPKEVFEAFFTELDSKLETLSLIFNANDYAYGFRTASLSYYWIEADLLP